MSDYHWYAAYTLPRFEKRAKVQLDKQGITNWLPMQRLRRRWSDRWKWVEEPVFRSYLFVHISEREYFQTLNSYGIIRFVAFNGQAVRIPENQMDFLRRMLDTGYELEAGVPDELELGDKVEVLTGPMAGRQGVLVSRAGDKKFRVDLDFLGQSVYITVPAENLTKELSV